MHHRRIKQALYAGVYLVVVSVFVGIIYFIAFNVPVSCLDGKHNGNEEWIDCGASCGNVCLPADFSPIRATGPVRILPVSARNGAELTASILFEVQNENIGIAAPEVPYTIYFYGADGIARGEVRGTFFIYEREIKYVSVPNISIGADTSRADISFGDVEWKSAEEFKKPILAVQAVRATKSDEGMVVDGTVANNDVIMLPQVVATALFYDASGHVVAVSRTELENVAPQEQRRFAVFHPSLASVDFSRTPRIIVEGIRR